MKKSPPECDDPRTADNRSYRYESHQLRMRPEYPIIGALIAPSSSVIDLACGDGSLAVYLRDQYGCRVSGIDSSPTGIALARNRGIEVREERIDAPIAWIEGNGFDYAVCNVSLQMLSYPEVTLREMKRMARYQIVSFPNFAYYKNRFDLFFKGRMPRPLLYGYSWYSTGHIHQLSIRDFVETAQQEGFRIIKVTHLGEGLNLLRTFFLKSFPNFFSQEAVFLMEADRESK